MPKRRKVEIIREPERFRMTGLSRVTFWRLERAGRAPKRVQLGENSIGWVRAEIEQWLAERLAARETRQ